VPAVLAAALSGVLFGCAEIRTAESQLTIDITDYDFAANPALLQRIAGSAHGYFRFINKQFAQVVCTHFRDDLALMPNSQPAR
jgi:hypothetical protein